MAVNIQETYSSPLTNYVEPVIIDGVEYTKFYTKLNTDLSVGDYVYILNGNYDNSTLIDQFEYQYGGNGYKILKIDRNSIVLDIPYRSEAPFNQDDFEDYTKVYIIDSLNKFNYENIDNGFGFDIFTGEKYSTLNNNVFLSQIENMPYTSETQTKDKFFKSYNFDGHPIGASGSRGQVIDDSTFLYWELEETAAYGLAPSGTGSSSIKFGTGKNFVKDFDLIKNTNTDKMVVLTSSSSSTDSTLWTWNKKTRDVYDDFIFDSSENQVDAHLVKPFETGYENVFPDKDIIRIKCPANLDGTFSFMGYTASATASSTTNGVDLLEYDVKGFSQNLVLGYSGLSSSNNYRSFGFYSNDSSAYMIPNPDNTVDLVSSTNSVPYSDIGATYTTPFFVLSTDSGSLGTYSGNMYFPAHINGEMFNVVPEYARFSGIGRPVKVEINDWINTFDQSQNLEYCFAGQLEEGYSSGGNVAAQGGLYFYSYSGNHEDLNTSTKYVGNAFELSYTTLLKYVSGTWSNANDIFNPFVNIQDSEVYDFLNGIKDIKWMGVEKRNFGLNLTTINDGETVLRNNTSGIYYTKYLLTTSIKSYYVFINYNYELLKNNEDFLSAVTSYGIPQVHCVISHAYTSTGVEGVNPTIGSVIGFNRIEDGDLYPYILDGEYVIGSLDGSETYKIGVNEPFTNPEFTQSPITSFDYSDERWIVGAGNTSPIITSATYSPTANGLYVYDLSVGSSVQNITTGTTFSLGENLPSDNVFKVRGEVIEGKRRIWASTENGIFLFDNDLSFDEEYYYVIDLDNKEIPLDSSLYKNDRLYIMEDFTYDGIEYKKGDICRWISEDKRWEIDKTYLQPYLTKSHFEDGSFLSESIFNDGIFGNLDTMAKWSEGTWRNGILYNAKWLDGTLQSKSDELVEQSYYSMLNKGVLSNTTDFENNDSYGYNLAVKSEITGGTIANGNFQQCTIGDISITGLMDNLLGSTYSFTYSNLSIDKGYFLHSDIYSTILNNSKIESSEINSSKVDNGSRIVNSDGYDTWVKDALIENKGRIKVKGYDKWYNIKRDLNGSDIIHTHKFYIDEKDFTELDFGDSIIFNSVVTDSDKATDILNNIFYVIGGTGGYYSDVYEDLNRIIVDNDDVTYATKNFKLFISKKLKTQNSTKSIITFNGTNLIVSGIENNNPQYSIDISIVVENIPFGSDPEVYLNSISNDGVLKFNAINTSLSTIQTNHFNSSWINGGQWINGSMITPNQLSNKFNIGTMSTYDNGGTMSIKLDINDSGYELTSHDILSVGDNIVIDNIWGLSFSEYVGGDFKVVGLTTSGSLNSVILEPYHTISLTASSLLTQPVSQYKFLNLNKLDGENNTLTIRSGFFKNQSFSNLTLNNSKFSEYSEVISNKSIATNVADVSDIVGSINSTDNRDLIILNSEITNVNNVTIKGGLFMNGQLSSDFGTSSNASGILNGFKQVFSNFDVNGGKLTKSTFLGGNFNGGLYVDNKYLNEFDLIPINNRNILTDRTAILPVWVNGTFNRGTFNKSIWMNGQFNNGRFINSEFLGGTFSNGIFGDVSSKPNINAFRKGYWKNGIFQNGIFGDNINRIEETNSVYGTTSYLPTGFNYIKDGTNVWETGVFNNGIFTTIDNNVSLWYDGDFNNGQVLDSVIWYDGVFNNGKFKSVYGRQVSHVVGQADLLTIASASVVSATSSEYGSRAVSLELYYNSDLDFFNQYNIASLRDTVKNKFNNPGTLVLDTSDYQLKYAFVSDAFTYTLSPFDEDLSYHGYTEYLTDEFYGGTGSTPSISIQFKPIDYLSDDLNKRNPIYSSNVLGSKIFVQDTGNEYIYDGSRYVTASYFLGLTISNTSFTYSTTYAWRDGVFNSGEFGGKENYDNTNPSWYDGTFNGGKFYGKIWRNGTFIRGDFNGSGSPQEQAPPNLYIYEGYNPQALIERYLNDFETQPISSGTSSQSSYRRIVNNWDWYGLWLDGKVLPNVNELSLTSDRVNENALVEYFKRDKFKRVKPSEANFNNMLWVNGTFGHSGAKFNKSVWLSGIFNRGNFNDSMFNPYVQRWDFESGDLSNVKFSFELDTTLSVWNNGVFNTGVFYYSDWNNGVFNYGTMVGGRFARGVSNYMSAFSTIWEGGRFRNGNWYGSNFTINNVSNVNSVPNPFEYLDDYFGGVSYPPFITDILSNNADRLDDDRLHIWNILGGSYSVVTFNMTGHDFGIDQYLIDVENGETGITLTTTTTTQIDYVDVRLEDVSSGTNLTNGVIRLEFEAIISSFLTSRSVASTPTTTTEIVPYEFNMVLSDIANFTQGTYDIDFYTIQLSEGPGGSLNRWKKFPELDYMEFTLYADIYTNGILTRSAELIRIDDTQTDNESISFQVQSNEEHILRVNFYGYVEEEDSTPIPGGLGAATIGTPTEDQSFTGNMYMEFSFATGSVFYTDDNNTLNGYIEPICTTTYLNSDITTVSGTLSYSSGVNLNDTLSYCAYDIATISVPTIFTNADGAYAQYGNGAFLEGIWENGVWNNGYRGTEFGTFIVDDINNIPSGLRYSLWTFGSGTSSYVYTNTLYNNTTVFQHRTHPTMYFNKVQRSFKISSNKWRFVLESAFNIHATETLSYSRISLGDQVSVGNIVAIDINGDRKLMKNVFTVVELNTSSNGQNRITLEYKETFPIDDIQIDSDRHLIYVQKNVWVFGSFLNGYFEGIMNGGYIRGNREITKLIDSHLIDVKFEGGRLEGSKYTISSAFDSRSTIAQSLSPQFVTKYNNLYHSTVVQNMQFIDDVTIRNYDMVAGSNVSIFGTVSNEKEIIIGTTVSTTITRSDGALEYIYNTDIDVVYEPEYFSSIYDPTIFNSHIIGQTRLGTSIPTKVHNIPAGYITYDILSSVSSFRYSLSPRVYKEKQFRLNLGSKYSRFNTLTDVNYTSPTTKSTIDVGTVSIDLTEVDTIPNTFNVVRSDYHGVYTKWFGSTSSMDNDGISFKGESILNVHEEFMYTFGTYSEGTNEMGFNLITANSQDFLTRGRYHVIEVDTEFLDSLELTNPYNISSSITINTTYSYSISNLPKLTIGQSYNELYEYASYGGRRGYLSPYDNDFIPYFEGDKLSEINSFTSSSRLTMKTFIYNNYGGFRDNVKVFQKGFDLSVGATSGSYNVNGPVYYSFDHYEVDSIPFYRYQDYIDPITGTISEWNVLFEEGANQQLTRQVDTRVKVPFYAVSVPIEYDNDNFVLTENINFLGGTNIDNNNVIDLELFDIIAGNNP